MISLQTYGDVGICACVVLVYFIICDQRPILHVNWKFIISEFMVYPYVHSM